MFYMRVRPSGAELGDVRVDRHGVVVPRDKVITEGLLTEYRSIRCLNYVKFFGNTDYDFPQELNGIN